MLSETFTFTKRQLGWLLVIGGVGVFAVVLGIDMFDVGREGGIGPAQQIALVVSAASTLLGLTLIPLGRMPA
ncbi:MAG: hypothetical protein JNM70_18495 [Anaerolineae bacterium]|nr:hypothetical protein [Anaerolineae bacterium]